VKVGFCNGCYDIFHDGHRHFLTKARGVCDYLIVAVNDDDSIRRLKGDTRPRWPLFCRISHVRNYANAVIPFDGDPLPIIAAIKPDILIRGEDQKVFPQEWGGKTSLVVLKRLEGISTTALIERDLYDIEEE
jgi:D-beta-D-heptose 7-phosphate kinase/D-beta-D-heptose 1-phosphate adenosyltransferase